MNHNINMDSAFVQSKGRWMQLISTTINYIQKLRPVKLAYSRECLLKYMYKASKVGGHVCKEYRLCLFLRFVYWILELFRTVSYFFVFWFYFIIIINNNILTYIKLRHTDIQRYSAYLMCNYCRVRVMVFSFTFNNISAKSWRSVLLVEETGGPRKNSRRAANHWQTFITQCCIEYTSIGRDSNSQRFGDRHWLHR